MAGRELHLSWANIGIGVVCVIVANIIAAVLLIPYLPGPSWIWSSLAVAVGVLVWFWIAARVLRK